MDEQDLHPGHKSIRLKGHDYSAPALYFVTICTNERIPVFGKVADGKVELNVFGQVARENWVAIPSHFGNANLHAFVIMPNHVHGIIEIACQVRAQHAAPLRGGSPSTSAKRVVGKGSLSAIMRSYKAAVTLQARRELDWSGEIWQRNYFERFLRDGQEFADATRYISENPARWEWDRENPKAKAAKRDASANGAQHAAPLQNRTRWN